MILEGWISPLISFSENSSALTVSFHRLSCFSPSPMGSFLYCWYTRRDIFCKAGNSLDNVTTRTERRCCSTVNISHDSVVLESFPQLFGKFKRQSRHSVLSHSLFAVRGRSPSCCNRVLFQNNPTTTSSRILPGIRLPLFFLFHLPLSLLPGRGRAYAKKLFWSRFIRKIFDKEGTFSLSLSFPFVLQDTFDSWKGAARHLSPLLVHRPSVLAFYSPQTNGCCLDAV